MNKKRKNTKQSILLNNNELLNQKSYWVMFLYLLPIFKKLYYFFIDSPASPSLSSKIEKPFIINIPAERLEEVMEHY